MKKLNNLLVTFKMTIF